jgi:hypothetical protein
MGYTHYYWQEGTIEYDIFRKIKDDFERMLPTLEHLGVKLGNAFGEGKPDIDTREIRFNGLSNCGHTERDLGITWPAPKAKGVVQGATVGGKLQEIVKGTWFAGAQLETRVCGGDCSHETFSLEQNMVVKTVYADGTVHDNEPTGKVNYIGAGGQEVLNPKNQIGKYFNCTKTAYKPYDLAVNVVLIIAKHYLGDKIIVRSDGEIENWEEGMQLVQHFLGYGEDFKLDERDES